MTGLKLVRLVTWTAIAVVIVAMAAMMIWRQAPQTGAAIAQIGGPFSLTDQTGARVTEADLAGHPSALFFGFTFCPDICPTTLFEMTARMEQLGPDADRLKVYFVTVDPERDTPEVMAEYLQAFDPRFVGLTGSRAEVDAMLEAYRVFWRKVDLDDGGYTMDHTASVYLLDANGVLTGTLDYQEDDETALAKLRRLIDDS